MRQTRPHRIAASARRLVATVIALASLLAAGVSAGAVVGVAAVPMPAAAAEEHPTIDGAFSGTGAIGAGETLELVVAGRGGVPAEGVGSVALNVTVTRPTAASFLTVWATGAPRPLAASLTMVRGQTTSNMVVAGVGDGGSVSMFNLAGAVDVVVDVVGWIPASGGGFVAVTPARLQDTRSGEPTVDGRAAGEGRFGARETRRVPVLGRGGVPAVGVGAVVLNVSVTNPTATSYVTVWPSGVPRPLAATLTMDAGETASTMVVSGVGADGAVSLFALAGEVDVVVDVLGWFAQPAVGEPTPFVPVTPARLQDTRAGEPTVDGAASGTGPLAGDTVAVLTVAGRGGVPAAGVGAVVLNVSVTGPTAGSFLTAWPTGVPRPLAATLTMTAGETTSNVVVTALGADGGVALYGHAGDVHVVVDVLGWVPTDAGFRPLTPARLADTRTPVVIRPTYPTGRCDTIAPGMDGISLLEGDAPDVVVQIGTSVAGRPIWAEYVGPPHPADVVLVVGQVHGNECAPSRFVRAVRARGRREHGVWLIPTLNPDGYAAWTRANAAGKDLNTDGATWSQPETAALMAFTHALQPALTIHVHSPNGAIGGVGTTAYDGGDPARSGAPLAGAIARRVAEASGLVIDPQLVRTDPARWFLWQGQRLAAPQSESLLVELHAVSDLEVPNASPRPPSQPVSVVDAEAKLVLDALEEALAARSAS